MTKSHSQETVIILNPVSGSADHSDAVRKRAEIRGETVYETHEAGDAVKLAHKAALAGASTIVAAGGDGTVNEVVRGIDQADAFEEATLGILPVGTGNNFAKNIGITDLDKAFSTIENGERRRIDIGQADDRPFLNSCVAGLTAESSSETSSEMKNRLGGLAYVITTLRSVSEFDPIQLSVEIQNGKQETRAWAGEAICVLVGNGRTFSSSGSRQGNMEDGLFDVTVIEDVPALDLMGDAIVEQLLGRDSPHLIQTQTSRLNISIQHPESIRFSLDGEIIQRTTLSLWTRPNTLRIAVGEGYSNDPE